jgi:pimeloyl-ACP methyl ester carboxylesterase
MTAEADDKMRGVRGLNLKVEDRGSGGTVLFLHGAGGSNWSPMLEQLSQQFRVIAPEHPGFGRSTIPEWMSTMSDLAYFYLDFMDSMELKNVHLVGHSLGGWLAAEIAVRNTSQLTSVTMMAPAGIANPDAPFGDIFLWGPEEAAYNQFYNRELAEKRLKLVPDLDIVLQNKAAAARLGWSPRLCNPQLKYWIHRIDRPVQFIWGKQDKIIPHDCHKAWMQGIDGAVLQTIEECGHSIHSEKAAEAADMISVFCHAKS